MKGLLLQDFYIIKKNLILCMGICAYFFVVLIIGSMDSESSSQIDIVMYALCGIIPCFMTSCSCFTIKPERTSKTSLFLHTLPLHNNTITKEKYLITYTLFFSSYIVISLFACINHLLCDYVPGKNMVFICFVIFSVILIFTNIELPITMRFGQAVAAAMIIAAFFLIIIIGLTVIVKTNTSPDLNNKISYMLKHKTELSLCTLIIDLISCCLSYNCAKHISRI